MKNEIIMLPTNSVTSIIHDTIYNTVHKGDYPIIPTHYNYVHLFELSNEEIKKYDQVSNGHKVWEWKDDSSLFGVKKVVSSTDKTLKNGLCGNCRNGRCYDEFLICEVSVKHMKDDAINKFIKNRNI